MSDTELRALNEISGRLGRLEALNEASTRATNELTANVSRLVDKLDKSDDIAREADQRAKSAHHRIDETNKRIAELEADIKWLWRTVIGAVITGVLAGAVAIVWKSIGGA